jgi:hypothetical protein
MTMARFSTIFILFLSLNLFADYPGNSVIFFGGDDYLGLDQSVNKQSDWTFQTWFKVSGDGERMIYSEGNPKVTLQIKCLDNNKIGVSFWNHNRWDNVYTDDNSYNTNEWNNLAITLKNATDENKSGEVKIYLNGQLVKEDSSFMENHYGTKWAAIGRNVGSTKGGGQSVDAYNGEIDELMIWYNDALSQEQIMNYMFNPPDLSGDDFIHMQYWDFNSIENEEYSNLNTAKNATLTNMDEEQCLVVSTIPVIDIEDDFSDADLAWSAKKYCESDELKVIISDNSDFGTVTIGNNSESLNMVNSNIEGIGETTEKTWIIQTEDVFNFSFELTLPDSVENNNLYFLLSPEKDFSKNNQVIGCEYDSDKKILNAIFQTNEASTKYYFKICSSDDFSNEIYLTSNAGFGPFTQSYSKDNSFHFADLPDNAESVALYLKENATVTDSVYFTDTENAKLNKNMAYLKTNALLTGILKYEDNPNIIKYSKWITITPLSPKITALTADSSGFTYRLGEQGEKIFKVEDLPDNTFEVDFNFYYANGNVIENANHIATGSNLSEAEWNVTLSDYDITLSTSLGVTFKHEGGISQGMEYLVPINVIPQQVDIDIKKEDRAFYFNGANDADVNYIKYETPKSFITNKNDWTIETLVFPTDENKGIIYSEGDPKIIFDFSITPDNQLEIGLFNEDIAGNWTHFYSEKNSVPDSAWSHIAVSLENASDDKPGNLKAYINGKLAIEVKSHKVKRTNKTIDFNIGKNVGSDNGQAIDAFKGYINEIKIWNKAITEQTIKEYMYMPVPPDEYGLEVYWSFDTWIESDYLYETTGNYPNAVTVNWEQDYVQVVRIPNIGTPITKNYDYYDNTHFPKPVSYSYILTDLPPQTTKVKYRIIDKNEETIDSLVFGRENNQYIDTLDFTYNVSNLPLNTNLAEFLIYCSGSNNVGITYSIPLNVRPRPIKVEWDQSTDKIFEAIGKPRNAFYFNGKGGIDFSSKSYLLEDYFTFQTWIFIEDLKKNDDIQWFFGKSPRIGIKFPEDNKPQIVFSGEHNGGKSYTFDMAELHKSQWVNITIIREYETLKFYEYDIHGVLQKQSQQSIDSWMSNEFTSLGYIKNMGVPFKGYLDNFRIWTKSVAENNIYDKAFSNFVYDEHLIINWDFDDPRNVKKYVYESASGKILGIATKGTRYVINFNNPKNSDDFPIDLDIGRQYFDLEITRSNKSTEDKSNYYAKVDYLDNSGRIEKSMQFEYPDNELISVGYNYGSLSEDVSKIGIKYQFPDKNDSTEYDEIIPITVLPPKPAAITSHPWNDLINGVELYNHFHIYNFHNSVDSVDVIIKSDKNDSILVNQRYTKNSIPYSHSLQFDGESNYITTDVKLHLIKDAAYESSSFAIKFWFKTSSTKGGSLIAMTENADGTGKQFINLYLDKNGKLHYGINADNNYFTANSQASYNDGKWHQVLAQFYSYTGGNQIFINMDLIVDAGKVDEKHKHIEIKNTHDYFLQGYLTLNGVNIDSDYPEAPDNQFLKYDITEFNVWNQFLYYSEYGKDLHKPTDFQNNEEVEIYFPFSNNGGNLIKDEVYQTEATIHGKANWFYDDVISDIVYTHNMGSLDVGGYEFIAKVYDENLPNGFHEYKINEIGIIYPWDDRYKTNKIQLSSNGGFGYFQEGSKSTCTFTFSADRLPDDNKLQVQVFDGKDDTSELKWGKTIDCSEYPVEFELDMGSFGPEHFFLFEINGGLYALVPLFIQPMSPPKLKGDFGPFTQAIVPGTMKAENTFNFVTGADDVTKVKVRYEDKDGYHLDDFDIELEENNDEYKGTINYDMAKLKPPYTNMFLDYYLGEDMEPEFTEGPFKIDIRRTQPHFFNYKAKFDDVETVDDTVFFTMKTPFDVSPTAEDIKKFKIDKHVPLFGSSQVVIDIPDLEAKCKYIISEKKLSFIETPDLTYKIKVFTQHVTERKFEFEEHHSNECEYCFYKLDENNELIAIQRDLHEHDIYIPIKEWVDLAKEIKEVMDEAEDVSPVSIIIKPSWSFDIAFAWASEYQTNVGIDDEGNWGSLGEIEPPEKGDDKTSHQYASLGGDVSLSAGVKILEGLASVEFNLTGGMRYSCGELHHTAGEQEAGSLHGTEIYLEFSVTAHELAGIFMEYIVHPKTLASHTWGDEIPENFPEVTVHWLGGGLSLQEEPPLHEANPAIRLKSVINPQPNFRSGENLSAVWLNQDMNTKYSSLNLTWFDKNNMQFSREIEIENNNNSISNPVNDVSKSGIAAIAWAESRYTQKTVPQGLSFEQLYKGHDIKYAVYDLNTDITENISTVSDDFSEINSGRIDNHPEIIMLSDEKGLLLWKAKESDEKRIKILYTTIDKNNNWIHSEIKEVPISADIITEFRIEQDNTDKVILSAILMDSANANQSRLETYRYNGSTWNYLSTLNNTGDNIFISEMDMSIHGEYGIL